MGQTREAPAPFKCNGRYYVITSGCSGWAPNAASYAVAQNILGPWQTKDNPCVGREANKTFRPKHVRAARARQAKLFHLPGGSLERAEAPRLTLCLVASEGQKRRDVYPHLAQQMGPVGLRRKVTERQYIHAGGHMMPDDVPPVIVKFFKQNAKP